MYTSNCKLLLQISCKISDPTKIWAISYAYIVSYAYFLKVSLQQISSASIIALSVLLYIDEIPVQYNETTHYLDIYTKF